MKMRTARNSLVTLFLMNCSIFAFGQAPKIAAVTGGADFNPSRVAEGGYVTVFGSGLADATYSAQTVPYGTKLGSTEILFCPGQTITLFCQAAEVAYASPGQVNIVLNGIGGTIQGGVPFSISGYIVARVNGVIDASAASGNPTPISIPAYAPSLFLAGSDCPIDSRYPAPNQNCGLAPSLATAGRVERGLITDQSGSVLWSGNPAHLGQYYTAWVTGLGAIVSGALPTPAISMTFLDVPAFGYANPSYGLLKVTYGGTTGQYPGLYQINFQIPLSTGEGPDGYGAWPCGNYSWELTLATDEGTGLGLTANTVQIPLIIRSGDVPCSI